MRKGRRPVLANRWRVVGVGALLAVVVMGSACSSRGDEGGKIPEAGATLGPEDKPTTEATQVGTVRLSDADCTLDAVRGPIPAGLVSVAAVNRTDTHAALHMWRIDDGHTYQEFSAYIAKTRRRTAAGKAPPDPIAWIGERIDVDLEAGGSGTIVGRVRAGTYGIVCIREFEKAGELHAFATVGPVTVV